MHRLFTILVCFWVMSTAYGQVTEGVQDKTAARTYLDYYRAVATAEETIVNGRYQDAIQQYRRTFDEYDYNNPIDCYVAAQVAAYTGDTVACIAFLTKGLCSGLPVQTISGNPHLSGYFSTISQRSVDSCWNSYRAGIDQKARAAMFTLIKRDQSVIHNLPKGESIYGRDGYTLQERYQPLWDSLAKAMIVLIQTYGFPAQKIIGTQNGDDSLFRVGPNSVFAYPIFIHHGTAWNRLESILWPELLKGNITPQMYGVIYESVDGNENYAGPVHYFAARECDRPACKKLVKTKLKEINNDRWQIGLCSYEVMQQKFLSRKRYFKWRSNPARIPEPVFDFECELSFQAKDWSAKQ